MPRHVCPQTPCDAVFVRMGARDNLAAGQSTFFVELSETAAMLSRATEHSLVALDELGRGTSTFDGAAIAAAVLDHVTERLRCRTLFATHYHGIARDFAKGARSQALARVMHMACEVLPADGASPERVLFLYKLADGLCPRSYGTHVARLAGLPASVVNRAAAKAALAESEGLEAAATGEEGSNGDDGGVGAWLRQIEGALSAGDVEGLRAGWQRCGVMLHE